jgi:uncharacterized membrane protein
MNKLLTILFTIISLHSQAQEKISWETLNDVSFTRKYYEEVDAYLFYPQFGHSVKELEGKEVYIKGHMLVMDRKENIYILSKNPYSSCYFCGSAGPETIIELHLKPGHARIKNDEVITIKGILKT